MARAGVCVSMTSFFFHYFFSFCSHLILVFITHHSSFIRSSFRINAISQQYWMSWTLIDTHHDDNDDVDHMNILHMVN